MTTTLLIFWRHISNLMLTRLAAIHDMCKYANSNDLLLYGTGKVKKEQDQS